jgi:hypothetical protein
LRTGYSGEYLILREGWRKLHNAELHNLLTSLNIIRMIKSRRKREGRDVAWIREKKSAYKFFVGRPI